MTDGFMRWYRERTTAANFARQKELFGAAGLLLEHPTREAEIMLDVDGNDVELSAGTIAELLELKLGPMHVEWWFSPDVNLICMYDYEPLGLEIQTYFLDSLTAAQTSVLEQLLVTLVQEQGFDTNALVIDRSGDTAEFDWNSAILYGRLNSIPYPELLILPAPAADRLEFASTEHTLSLIESVEPNLVCIRR